MFAAGKTAGASAASAANYIEDVFSVWLYQGNGSTQTITNGIDLAGEGGLVWIKNRQAAIDHVLFDTARGTYNALLSDSTGAQSNFSPYGVTAFGSTGFSVGDIANGSYGVNGSAGGLFSGANAAYTSWTFRKQPKFFDVVTWTGNGLSSQTIPHSLGSAPGCVIIKSTGLSQNWWTYHRSLGTGSYVTLNTTNAAAEGTIVSATSSTDITVGSTTTSQGYTYVAYIFAHNAGGFGLTGTDNVISCGSFTTNGSGNATVNLGYEPQWLLIKRTNSTGAWYMWDTMRGLPVTASSSNRLSANTSAAEVTGAESIYPTATGFTETGQLNTNSTYIYIAIRRGPMKVPTDGTSVFAPVTYSGDSTSGRLITSPSFPTDLMIGMVQNKVQSKFWWDRLRGASQAIRSDGTDAEWSTGSALSLTSAQNGFVVTDTGASYTNTSTYNYDSLCFRRAPGFFDEVCYTGNGSGSPRNINHNLTVAPELTILKCRSTSTTDWPVWASAFAGTNKSLLLNTTDAAAATGLFTTGSPTATTFVVATDAYTNLSGRTYVAYLFASCPGVSKVGSYTGNGSTQTINCGFTGGARFVLIKRTDSTGDWYVYDTARGMTTLTDPYLRLNSTAAESATLGSVTTVSTGFAVDASILAAVNTNAATYIYFSVA